MTYQPFRPSRIYSDQPTPTEPATFATDATQTMNVAQVACVASLELENESPKTAWHPLEAKSSIATHATNATLPANIESIIDRLEVSPPLGVGDLHRWRAMLAGARTFFAEWGEKPRRLGWDDVALFGLHPDAPLVRREAMGIALSLADRERVLALSANTAAIETRSGARLTFYRPHHGTGAVPAWELVDARGAR